MPHNNQAKFAFYYLLSLISLIFTALAVGQIAFQYINKYLPDIFGKYGVDFSPAVLNFAVSAIIIATPVFFITTNLIYRQINRGRLDLQAGIRRWLTYFILLVSAVVIIAFLITTINNFLNGDWTIKFLLKMLTVIIIAGAAFSFYFLDIRRTEITKKNRRIGKIYFFGSLIIIVIAFIGSLFILESPQTARGRLIDQQIINNFNSVETSVANYYMANGKLPADLRTLKADNNLQEMYSDPVTQQNLGYEIINDSSYKLCATFRTDNLHQRDQMNLYIDESQRHPAGYYCLTQKIYPDNNKIAPIIN